MSGADLVFSAAKPSRLPEGYTEVEWIANLPNASGVYAVSADMNIACDVKTPFVSTANRRYEFELKLPETGTSSKRVYLFGSNMQCTYKRTNSLGGTETVTNGHESDAAFYASSSQSYLVFEGMANRPSYKAVTYPTDRKFNVILTTPKVTSSTGAVAIPVIVDGVTYTVTSKQYAYTTGIKAGWCLFGYLYSYKTTTSYSVCTIQSGVPTPMSHPMYLYSFKVYDTSSGSDVLINDWVPCKNPDGKAGLIDLISGTFVSEAVSTAPFTAGPAV